MNLCTVLGLTLLAAIVKMDFFEFYQKPGEACYDLIGCFSTKGSFGVSYERPFVSVPDSPEKLKTVFKLYTREYKTTSQDLQGIDLKDTDLILSHFLKGKQSKIVVHGFMDNPALTSWLKTLKDKLLGHADFNVIIVDWSKGNLPPYTQATSNTRVIGAQIAELVKQLIKTKNVTASDFHLIGHSLGAHICGYAGERIPGLGRITGLDPAGPGFEDTDTVVRLDPTDAVLVDVIHTDAVPPIQFGMGITHPVGHLDFYPNLGRDQPGCKRDPFSKFFEWGFVQGMAEIVACNHMRSVHLFTESIDSHCPFVGFLCHSEEGFKSGSCRSCKNIGCAYMGLHADRNLTQVGQSQKVFLTTADKNPFCQYHMNIVVRLATGDSPGDHGKLSLDVVGDRASSGTVHLSESSMKFNNGEEYKFHISTTEDIGSLQHVVLFFARGLPTLEAPAHDIQSSWQKRLHIQEIEIERNEITTVTRFCANGTDLEGDRFIIINNKC